MTPAKASQNKNEKKVFANLYGDLIYLKHFVSAIKFEFQSISEKGFDKDYTRFWSEKIFLLLKYNHL